MKSRCALIGAIMFALLAVVTMSGCQGRQVQNSTSAEQAQGGQGSAEQTTTTTPQEGDSTLYTPTYKPNGKETAVLKTSKGDITVELFGADAPIHVGNFVELAEKGFYNGTRFHRFEPGFVIQGGDPQTKGLSAEQVQKAVQTGNPPLGTGGPGYTIKGEFDPSVNPNKHVEGALGMARSQSPDSGGSQFYFTVAPAPFLDGQYTVFGKITEGLDVMKQLRVGDEIVSVTIQGASK